MDGLVGGLQGGGAPPGDELLRGGDGLAGGGGQGVAPRPYVLQRVRRESHAAAGGGRGRRGGRRQRERERGRGQARVQALFGTNDSSLHKCDTKLVQHCYCENLDEFKIRISIVLVYFTCNIASAE